MKAKQKLLCLIMMAFLFMTLAKIHVFSSPTAQIYVDPSIAYEGIDASINVTVGIRDVVSLYSWQVNMSFDSDVLEYLGVIEGTLLKDQPEGTYGPPPRIKEDWVFFGWATVGKHLGITGTGTLAIVEFKVKTIGESAINITNKSTKLVELHPPPVPPGGQMFTEIPYTAENGFFTNLVDPPTAEFTFSPSLPVKDEQVNFDASASSPTAPLVIDSYRWDFGDGTTKIYVKDENLTETTTHTYTEAAVYTVTLTVTDNASASDLIKAIYGTTTMPLIWYELYSTKTATIDIKFGHDIVVKNVTVSGTEVTAGETVSINVTVSNNGVEKESFNVTTYYGDNIIETKQVPDLLPGGNQSLIFDWNTKDVAAGTYKIRAEAPLEGDGTPDNNSFLDGTVKVNAVAESFPVWIIGIGVAAVVLVVLLFLYMRRRGSSP